MLGIGGDGSPSSKGSYKFSSIEAIFCHKTKCLSLCIASRVVKKILKAWSKDIWGCRDGAAAAELVPLPE